MRGPALLAVPLLLLLAGPAPAQHAPGLATTVPGVADVPAGPGTLRGRIVHATRPDAAGGLPVVLYALPASGEPGLRGATSDPDGSFVFENVSNDPSTSYLVGVSFAEIPFGARVSFAAGETEHELVVRISDPDPDTSAVVPGEVRVRFERGCGGLQVFESYEMRNPGDRVIAVPEADRGTRAPVFETGIPERATDFGAATATQGGVERDGSRVRFWGPLYPGSQSVELAYALPVGGERVSVRRSFPSGAARVVLLTHEKGPVLRADGLREGEPVTEDGGRWRTAVAEDLAPGAVLDLALELPPAPPAPEVLSLSSAQLTLELDEAALQVNERYALENANAGPLVAATDAPLLCVPLPEHAQELRFSTPTLAMGLTRDPSGPLAVRGPLPPGRSFLSLRYLLPTASDAVSLPLRFPLALPLLSIYVADTGLVAESGRLHRRRPVLSEDRTYMHFEAFEIAPDETVALSLHPLPAGSGTPRVALVAFVALAAAGSLAFLAAPLRGRRRALEERPASAAQLERESVYAALRDLDHDFETGKLADEDYESFRRELRGRAVELLREERRAPEAPEAARPPSECPKCSAPVAADARFCSQCGAPLVGARAVGDGAA